MQPPGAAIPYNVGRRAAIGVQGVENRARDVQHATRHSGASTRREPRRHETRPALSQILAWAQIPSTKNTTEDENRKSPRRGPRG